MCPHCNAELDELGIVVQAKQFVNATTGYSRVEDIEETLGYFCPNCGNGLDYDFADDLAEAMIDEYESSEGGE